MNNIDRSNLKNELASYKQKLLICRVGRTVVPSLLGCDPIVMMRADLYMKPGRPGDRRRRPAGVPSPRAWAAGAAQPVRVGFVPLLDAAPLIVAHHNGYFAEEDVPVVLERQIGWGNIRDKLTFGRLDAAHAPLGMPLLSALGRDGFTEPLVAAMNLGCGTDAITFGRRLTEAGVDTAASLATFTVGQAASVNPPVIAHVFGCSVHHYLLRSWLAAAGVNPDVDVRLCVLPPPQVAAHLAHESIDGFCVGEPWNTLAVRERTGRIAAVTSDVVPSHPDKVLAVTRRWSTAHPDALHRLIRAVLRGVQFCGQEQNVPEVARLLSVEPYLNLPAELVEQSLLLPQRFAPPAASESDVAPPPVSAAWCRQAFELERTFPSVTHHIWLATEMSRWGHLPRSTNAATFAACVASDGYRAAAGSFGIECPVRNDPPMPLADGWFEADQLVRRNRKVAVVYS